MRDDDDVGWIQLAQIKEKRVTCERTNKFKNNNAKLFLTS